MRSALFAARHHIRDIQRTARRYHEATQTFLDTADRIAEDIATKPWTTPSSQTSCFDSTWNDDRYQPSTDWYRHNPTTQRLTQVIDGSDDTRWNNRYETFSEELSSLTSEQAAYLHGYLDAQTYLNDEHPVLAHTFHETVNYDGLGYSTQSRRTTSTTRPTKL